MRDYSAKDVDAYIAGADEIAWPHLNELRKLVKATILEAQEGISYGIPFYKYHGLLTGFSVFPKHLSFGFVTQLASEDRQALEAKGYKTGSKTVQIKYDQKVPTAEIKNILKTAAKQNEAKKAAK